MLIQPNNIKQKLFLRKYYRDLRSLISLDYRVEAGLSAARVFSTLAMVEKARHVACYLPVKDEFDSQPLIDFIWRMNKQCYLPVLSGIDENTMIFVEYAKGDSLHANRYGILEPANHSKRIVPTKLDIVVTPLVAFDLQGHRLGTGGGYYDRAFQFKHEDMTNYPLLLGLGYALQQVEQLQADTWDVSLDGIITENEFIDFSFE